MSISGPGGFLALYGVLSNRSVFPGPLLLQLCMSAEFFFPLRPIHSSTSLAVKQLICITEYLNEAARIFAYNFWQPLSFEFCMFSK
jgi:hypothetical protein